MSSSARTAMTGGLVTVVSMIVVVICLYVFPSVLDARDEARSHGHLSAYIALEPTIKIVPTLVLLGFIFVGVVGMFFGGRQFIKGVKGD